MGLLAAQQAGAAEVAPLDDGMFHAWRTRLVRTCCSVSGAAMIVAPLAFSVMTGAPMPGLALLLSVGALILALPWLGDPRSLVTRLAFVVALSICVGRLDYLLGWAPGNVALSTLLLTATGLLLNRRVGYVLIAFQALALWLGGQAVARGTFAIDSRVLDPTQFGHWLRVAIIFGLLGSAFWALLRSAAGLVSEAYAESSKRLALAERQRAVSHDMREARIEAERSLRGPQKLQAVAQLAVGLAHLLNNQLTVIAAALHDLAQDSSLPMRRDVAQRIEAAVVRAGATIRQLLVFSRSDEPAAVEIDLAREVETITDELRPTISSDIDVEAQGAPGCLVYLEPTRLHLVVLNLLMNAVDALPAGGTVRITVRAERDDATGAFRVALILEDSGTGMDREVLRRACDTFFTTQDRALHAGLGLSVAAGIVEQSGGVLSIESAPGRGTRVHASWPALRSMPTPAEIALPMLHPARLTPLADDDVRLPIENDAVTIDADAWKGEMTIRLARVGAAVMVPVMLAVWAFTPRAPSGFYGVVGLAALGLALAGWSPRLDRERRLWVMLVVLSLAITTVLGWFTFNTAGAIAAMSLVLSWAALLGPAWAGPAAIGYFVTSLIGVGALVHFGVIPVRTALTTMDNPANWARVAVSLSTIQIGVLASVSAILDHAVRAIRSMIEAGRRVERARQAEEEEGARALLLEQEASRVARMSINGTAAGSIAHDLNNGLQALLLSTLLNDERLTTSRIQDIARDLRQSAAYCRALLAMVGEEPHARSEDAEPIDLSEALGRIREVLPFFIGSAATASIEIAKGCRAAMHESDLQRIVVNLAANARDAMPHGGTLHIRLSREGERVVLEVKDDGIGMDERTRARAFEPFFTTKPAGQGTGLGLHATSQIVTDTHGTITCTSELGVGTSFRLSWPAVAVAHIQTAAPLHPEEPVIRGRILVAEDEPMVRGVITQALRAVGYDVVEAGDGDAALAMVEGGRSWIALCIDGVMPGHASADIIDSFVSRNPGRPVLLCSGHLPKELERRRLANAAVSFLPKPFSPTELQGALANAIAKCATRQAS